MNKLQSRYQQVYGLVTKIQDNTKPAKLKDCFNYHWICIDKDECAVSFYRTIKRIRGGNKRNKMDIIHVWEIISPIVHPDIELEREWKEELVWPLNNFVSGWLEDLIK